MCQPGTLVQTVYCELYLHVTLAHMIPLLVEYINALHSCLNTKTFFSLSHLPLARSTHIRHYDNILRGVEIHTCISCYCGGPSGSAVVH
jgi:hypothetical protein